jgi:hypothetical protein
MAGFMAEFEADLSRSFGAGSASGGTNSSIVLQISLAGQPAGSIAVPTGATICETLAVGSGGGGGGTYTGPGGAGPGGGGAYARSRFSVAAGKSLGYSDMTLFGLRGGNQSSNTLGGNAAATVVTYNGATVCQADGGYGGSGVITANTNGAPGAGGQVANCVGNIEVRGGQAGIQNATSAGDGGNIGGSAPAVTSIGGVTASGSTGVGFSGSGYGAGGSGAHVTGTQNYSGGNGLPGYLVVTFYSA